MLRIQIANYDEDWNFLCHGDQDVSFDDGSESRNADEWTTADFTFSPNPALAEAFIDLTRLKNGSKAFRLSSPRPLGLLFH